MNPLRAWNRFWFAPVSARPLGAFRVCFGLLVLSHIAMASVDLDHWFTDAGLLRGTESRETAGPLRFSVLHTIQDPTSVRLFFAGTTLATVGFILGWKTRVMSVLMYLGMLSLHHRNVFPDGGQDNLVVILCFYAMLAPCGAAFSLDARRLTKIRGTSAEPLIVPWSQRLIQLQTCLVYLDTFVIKCSGNTWLAGTAIHPVLFNPEIRRIDLEFLAGYPILINILTYGALAIELGLPFLLWSKSKRPLMIWSAIALHGGIFFLVNAPLFGEMLIATFLLFMGPDEVARLLHALNPARWTESLRLRRWMFASRLDPAGELSAWRQLELGFTPGEERA